MASDDAFVDDDPLGFFDRCDGDDVFDDGASLLCSTTISVFNDARQFWRLDRFFEAGAELSISKMSDSSRDPDGEVGG